MASMPICKVFSATMFADRELLGERITSWLAETGAKLTTFEPRLSSDNEFHCLSFSCAGTSGTPGVGAGRIRSPNAAIGSKRWFSRIRVFATTKANERERMGDRVQEWLTASKIAIDDCEIIVMQSSDSEFHCLVWVVLS
jgi:hypothetical protein